MGTTKVGGGNQEYKVREAGNLHPPVPPLSPALAQIMNKILNKVHRMKKLKTLEMSKVINRIIVGDGYFSLVYQGGVLIYIFLSERGMGLNQGNVVE